MEEVQRCVEISQQQVEPVEDRMQGDGGEGEGEVWGQAILGLE